MRGTIRQLGMEGGLWALITKEGKTVELLDPPKGLQRDGLEVELEGTREGAEVSVGMVGDALTVTSWREL